MALWLTAQEGRWTAVQAELEPEGDPNDAWYHATLAEMLAGSGDASLVEREALRILELDRGLATNLSVLLAYIGDLPAAERFARYLPPGSPRESAYRAVVRWRSGDAVGAVGSLREVVAVSPLSTDPNIPPPLLLLGEALADAGRDAEAVEVLRRYRDTPAMYPTWFWPRSEWLMARSLERVGQREAARETLSRVLQLWGAADASQPGLAEARELAARLEVR
jgi:predicted Zn-dependent protease